LDTLEAVDEELLAAAKRAEEQLTAAEHEAVVGRVEFHRAVRRLHRSGASLHEVARALHLSHRWVHQIVEAPGEARRWGMGGRHPPDLACSFCGRWRQETRTLVAGPGVYICEKCVDLAEAVITSRQVAETPPGPLQHVPEGALQPKCSFCGKHRHQVTGLATTVDNPAGDEAICAECLSLCREIQAEH